MKATTNNRAEASRRNGQKSQGPATAEGKASSAKNSFKHGLYAKHAVLDEEDAAALESLREDLRSEHQPINHTEGILVEELAMNYWSINRYRTLEVNAINNNAAFPTIIAIQRFLTASQRAFHRVLKELQTLQKQRGFVPQNAGSPAETAAETAPEPIIESTPDEPDWQELYNQLPAGVRATVDQFKDIDLKKQFAQDWFAEEAAAA